MTIYTKYKNLHTAERDFLWSHPLAAADFNSNATTALDEATKRFSHNGSGDAFRHCFWSAMNTRDQSKELAKKFGDAHEDFDGNPTNEKIMDTFNNGVGYEIGNTSPGASDRHLAVLCVQTCASSRLIQMNGQGKGDLIYSNKQEDFLYKR